MELETKKNIVAICAIVTNIALIICIFTLNSKNSENIVIQNMLSERIDFLEEDNEESVKLIEDLRNNMYLLQEEFKYLN